MTVPAFPTSIEAGPINLFGRTSIAEISVTAGSLPVPESLELGIKLISTPSAVKPLTINSVSLEMSGRINLEGVAASAASTNARFVADFEPGIVISAEIGLAPLNGAFQSLITEF